MTDFNEVRRKLILKLIEFNKVWRKIDIKIDGIKRSVWDTIYIFFFPCKSNNNLHIDSKIADITN